MLRRILIALGVVAVVLLAVPVSNLFRDQPYRHVVGQPILAPRTAVLATLDAHCVDCHDPAARRPFYGHWPGAERVIESDVTCARAAFDLDTAFRGGPPDGAPEVVLARLEHVVRSGEMPPARYVAAHWDGALPRGDREQVLKWIAATRARYYAPPALPEELRAGVVHPVRAFADLDWARVALGRRLFHDARLSGDGRTSCATCHDLEHGGVDGRVVSLMPDGQASGVNTPTLFNAALQARQGWKGHAADLREQADHAVRSPIEMAATWEAVLPRLAKDKDLVRAMRTVYPEGVSRAAVTDALAVFQRSLVTPGARFDRYLMGDDGALDAAEKRGYHVFVDAGCATCHVGKALGGQSLEPVDGRRAARDPDRAWRPDTVKVPMLRNVAATAPYLHDGSVPTLRQAVAAMGSGRVRVPLTEADVDDVTAFLRSLNGQYDGRAVQ